MRGGTGSIMQKRLGMGNGRKGEGMGNRMQEGVWEEGVGLASARVNHE